MRFGMVIVEVEDDAIEPDAVARDFEALAAWWARLRSSGRLVASGKLAPRRTARTVSWRDGVPLVTDGPFIEAKESIAGIAIVDVESDADAIDLAKSWPCPTRYRIEVRAIELPP